MERQAGEPELARDPHQGGADARTHRTVAAQVDVETLVGGGDGHVEGLAAVAQRSGEAARHLRGRMQRRHGDRALVDRHQRVAARRHQAGLGPALDGADMEGEPPPAGAVGVDRRFGRHGEPGLRQGLRDETPLPGELGRPGEVLGAAAAAA